MLYAQGQPPAPAHPAVHLTLPAAVDMAIAHNRKLTLARLAIHESEEQKRIAQSHYYPGIRNESAVLHITELEGIVFPPGSLSHGTVAGPVPAETLRIDQGAATSYTSGTGLDQPFTQMFKIRAGVRAADADLTTARIQAADAEDTIALQVHQLYFNYLIEQLNRSTAEDAVKASTLTEEENQKELQEGHLLANAELSSRADLLDKRRAVLISTLNLDDLTLQLDDVLGLPFGTKLELDPNGLGELPAVPARDAAIQEVLEKSPTVLAARQTVEKARAGVSAARDAYIPNITGIARYSYQSGLPFLLHNFGTFGASFTYDLFDGGAREANLRDARIKLTMAETQLAQDEDDVRVELSAAYDKVEQLEELLKVSQLMLETREESYRIVIQQAQVDAALESSVASAHSATTSARLGVLSSQLSLYLAQSNIKKLLGQMPR
jgi:outer membrane protein TolC